MLASNPLGNSMIATFHRGSREHPSTNPQESTSNVSSTRDRPLGPEEEKFFRLVAEDDPVADELFCHKAVERLVLAGKLEEALHFADSSLPNGKHAP